MLLINNWFCFSILLVFLVLAALVVLYQRRQTDRYKLRCDEHSQFRERYAKFIDLLPLTVIELNAKGRIISLNKAGYDFLGLTDYALDKGVFIQDLIVADQRARFKQDMDYVLEGGLNKGQEFILESKVGKNDYINIYFSLINNSGGRRGIRGVIIDVSESKRLERKAFRAVIETEERERKRYSEDLHDGLGPLLSTIKLYINQMNRPDANAKERTQMLGFSNDLIDEAITTTRTIANNILPTSIGDNGLWAAIVAFCNNIEKTGTVSFTLSNSTGLVFQNKAANNIYRIIIELINNSIKHAQAERINISFKIDKGKLQLIYSDDGIGIPENINKGLGLGNIKNRAHSLGGQFRFFNMDGMRFELLLPLKEITE